MENKKINLKSFFEKMKPADYVYLGVLFIFLITTLVLFSYSTKFVIENINKILSPSSTNNSEALNIDQYNFVVKKIGLSVNMDDSSTTEILPDTTSTTQTQEQKPEQEILDKKSISIEILNSTTKKGIASALNKSLTDSGFSSAITGNEKKSYAVTTILINESKKEFATLLQEVVNKTYPGSVTQFVKEKTGTDVTIIIGKK